MAGLLKDKNIAPRTITLLRQVNAMRQVEIVEMLVAAGNYTDGHVEALILGTPQDQLIKPVAVKKRRGFTRERIARLEQEMEMLQLDFKAVEAGDGQNILHLTLARAYIRKLLENGNVARFLQSSQADIHAGFEKLAAAEAL